MSNTTHTLTFLGTGASCGVPSFYCGCAACSEARSNPLAARDCSDLLISGKQNTLIDAAPELRLQLIRERVGRIDQALVTHEHFDHVGGLPQLEYYVKLSSGRPVPVYASDQTLAAIGRQFSFMTDALDLQPLLAWQSVEFDDVRYRALPATHCDGAFGFLIQTPSTRLAYFPDTGPLSPEVLEQLVDLDLLLIDATFNGSNWMPHSHHSVDEAIALAQRLRAKKTYLTHLSMHYDTPTTMKDLEERLDALDGTIAVAHDGLRIAI
jgi:phosphoribosyl 1,2-cyclic phosphate phosphodiesterase